MIYLSRLMLDPRSRAVRADLADCHALHRTILGAFPSIPAPSPGSTEGTIVAAPSSARDHFDVLYRVDGDRRSPGLTLLVQSNVVPNWSRLLDGYLALAFDGRPNPDCKPIGDLYDNLREGMLLAFRLRANPTKKVDTRSGADGARRNGRRLALHDEDKQHEWLLRKGLQHGFAVLATSINPAVLDVRATDGGKVIGIHRPSEDGAATADASGRLTFGSVLFEGRMRVVDPVALRAALVDGIGSGKAYGFGLLSIAPVRG